MCIRDRYHDAQLDMICQNPPFLKEYTGDPELIAAAEAALSLIHISLIKKLHLTLKSGTSDSRKDWFAVGEYKKLPNEVGGRSTTAPERCV